MPNLSHGEKLDSEQNFYVILCTNNNGNFNEKSLTCKPQLQVVIPFCTSHDPSHFLMTFSSILNKHKKCNPVNFWQFWGRHSLSKPSQDPLGKLVPKLILHPFEHNVWINIWKNFPTDTGTLLFFLKRIEVKAGPAKFRMGMPSKKLMLCFSFPISSLAWLINLYSLVNTCCQGAIRSRKNIPITLSRNIILNLAIFMQTCLSLKEKCANSTCSRRLTLHSRCIGCSKIAEIHNMFFHK